MAANIADLINIIFSNHYFTLGTSDRAGRPWVVPVVYGCDRNMNFYWVSGKDARHSCNHRIQSRTAAVIFDSHQTPGKVQAVYLEGQTTELGADTLQDATQAFYSWRYPDPAVLSSKLRGPEQFLAPSPRRMYQLQVDATFALDPAGDPLHGSLLDYRVPVMLLDDFRVRFARPERP